MPRKLCFPDRVCRSVISIYYVNLLLAVYFHSFELQNGFLAIPKRLSFLSLIFYLYVYLRIVKLR